MTGFTRRSRLSLSVLTVVLLGIGCNKSDSTTKAAGDKPTAGKSEAGAAAEAAAKPKAAAPSTEKADPAKAKAAAQAVLNKLGAAKVETARLGADNIMKAVLLYYAEKRAWPKGLSTLRKEALISPRGELDPWGARYAVTPKEDPSAKVGVTVCSPGPDAVLGTEDDICAGTRE